MVSVAMPLPTTALEGGNQKAAVCYPAVQVQWICDVPGDEDLHGVSTLGWQRRGFGCLCVQRPVDVFIHQAVKIQRVKNIPPQEEVGRQDRVTLRVGPPSPLARRRMLETRICRVAALCEFRLLLLFGMMKAVAAIDVILVPSGSLSPVVGVGERVGRAGVLWRGRSAGDGASGRKIRGGRRALHHRRYRAVTSGAF